MANEVTIAPPRLPYHPAIKERFGIDSTQWRALVDAVFPNAKTTTGVILALSYCAARKLDPMKKMIHIVPIWDSAKSCEVETIWPGIGEIRVTAYRTGQYAGKEPTAFGQDITQNFSGSVGKRGQEQKKSFDVTFPEWAQVTVYRLVAGIPRAFAGSKIYWLETYSTTGKTDLPNQMWQDRPRGQLEKCAEAAALRAAFPEEVGNDLIDDEARGVVSTTGVAIAKSDPLADEAHMLEADDPTPQTAQIATAAAPAEQPEAPSMLVLPNTPPKLGSAEWDALFADFTPDEAAEYERTRDARINAKDAPPLAHERAYLAVLDLAKS